MRSTSRQKFNNRRSNHRYPINAEVSYKVALRNSAVLNGIGRIVNMSSGGILVETGSSLPRGVGIELSIAWPAKLNSVAALKLHVVGRTIRTQGNLTAVLIRRYEFRTRGKPIGDRESALA